MVYANFFPLGDQVHGLTQYILGNRSTIESHPWPYHPHNFFLIFGKQYFDRRKNHSSTVS